MFLGDQGRWPAGSRRVVEGVRGTGFLPAPWWEGGLRLGLGVPFVLDCRLKCRNNKLVSLKIDELGSFRSVIQKSRARARARTFPEHVRVLSTHSGGSFIGPRPHISILPLQPTAKDGEGTFHRIQPRTRLQVSYAFSSERNKTGKPLRGGAVELRTSSCARLIFPLSRCRASFRQRLVYPFSR